MCDIVKSDSEIDTFIKNRLEKSKNEKIAIVLVGGPGSGKSEGKKDVIRKIKKTIKDFVNIDPDEILTTLFENKNECRKEVNIINDQSYEMSISQGKNIIFDGTGKDFDWYSANVLKRLKDSGYKVSLVIVMNNVEIVLERIKKRAEETGRDVPVEYTQSVYDALSNAIPRYLSLDCTYADSIYLYDNSKETIHLVYSTNCVGGVREAANVKSEQSLSKNKKSTRKLMKKKSTRRNKSKRRSKLNRRKKINKKRKSNKKI
jgi:predicted ABC-type ATPase